MQSLTEPKTSNSSILLHSWPRLKAASKISAFNELSRPDAEELFFELRPTQQANLIKRLPLREQRSWLRLLHPENAADVIQRFPAKLRPDLIEQLDADTKMDVIALMAYAEDRAGGLMNPRYVRLRPGVTVDVEIRYLRAQASGTQQISDYGYVLDQDQKLKGVIALKELLLALPEKPIEELMQKTLVWIPEDLSQNDIKQEFVKCGLRALPVLDKLGRMKGVVSLKDFILVAEEEATKDIQKLGGSEALDEPYLGIGMFKMIRKRAGWLTVLFLGEMFTATAMGYFEKEIAKAVVLALFIPLIISSGGNSGSQATSLIIRALALREVQLRDWWRVFVRELAIGTILGVILGAIGFLRIMLWPTRNTLYGEHYLLVAGTVSLSLVGIVLWGSLAGSMLPFILRKLKFDPATASAPFVATLVDVTGLIIYFSVAILLLKGTML